MKALYSILLESDVVVGIEAQHLAYNNLLLEFAYRCTLRTQSFFTQPGGDRHNTVEYAKMCIEIDEDCLEIKQGLTSSWLQPKCSHHFWWKLPGNMCCQSVAQARQRTSTSLKKVGVSSMCSLQKDAANK